MIKTVSELFFSLLLGAVILGLFGGTVNAATPPFTVDRCEGTAATMLGPLNPMDVVVMSVNIGLITTVFPPDEEDPSLVVFAETPPGAPVTATWRYVFEEGHLSGAVNITQSSPFDPEVEFVILTRLETKKGKCNPVSFGGGTAIYNYPDGTATGIAIIAVKQDDGWTRYETVYIVGQAGTVQQFILDETGIEVGT